MRIAAAIARDPIFHFAIATAVLFGAHALSTPDRKPEIRVEATVIDALLAERAMLMRRPQTEQDRQELTAAYIGEEILLREARRQGLDRAPRIRAQLIQTMRFALSGHAPTPSEADLRRYHTENLDRFKQPARLDLTQVFFPHGAVVPDNLRDMLNGGARPDRMGDPDPRVGATLRHAAWVDLVGLFGPEAAAGIDGIADGLWHGPFETARGRHIVRIDRRWPPENPAFEQLAGHIASEWALRWELDAIDRKIAVLGRGYTIVHPARTGGE